MQKLNICHILEDGRFGGPHKLFVNLISKTNVNYRNSAVFFRHQSAKFETEIKKYKIKYKIFDLPYLSKTSIFNYFLYFIKFYKSFIKNYEICNNDYFVVHQPNKSFISIVTLILLKKKIIFYFHDNYSNFIFKFIIEFFFKNKICGCIFSSYSSLNFYKKFKKIKKEIIYSSAKKSKFNKKKSKKNLLLELVQT